LAHSQARLLAKHTRQDARTARAEEYCAIASGGKSSIPSECFPSAPPAAASGENFNSGNEAACVRESFRNAGSEAAPLFRPEAVDFQQDLRAWGSVALLQPISSKIASWAIVVSVAVVCAFLFLAEYARKETVRGYLTPTAGTAKIFVQHQGIISATHVKEGQSVEEGEALLTVDTTQITTAGTDLNATMLDGLRSQRAFLLNQIKAQEERAGSERARLSVLISGTEEEIAQLQTQITAQSERMRLSHHSFEIGGELKSKGYLAEAELNRRFSATLEQQQILSALRQHLAARQNQLADTRYTLHQLPVTISEKIQAIRTELSAVDQRIAELGGRRAYVVKAPIAGRVSTLQASVGQHADPRRLQMEIVPSGMALQAELFVPTRAAGFVMTGQQIRIMYDAFPYQSFGTYAGRITKISRTLVTAADATGPFVLSEPAYRVTAAVERSHIETKTTTIPLQPDMLLRADIILERRTLVRWLLDPVIGIRM
jgi:membrane fusion protein